MSRKVLIPQEVVVHPPQGRSTCPVFIMRDNDAGEEVELVMDRTTIIIVLKHLLRALGMVSNTGPHTPLQWADILMALITRSLPAKQV